MTLIVALLFANTGCYTTQKAPVPASEPPSPYFDEPVCGITTQSGDYVAFDEPGEVRVRGIPVAAATVRSSRDADVAVVHGSVAGAPYEIPFSDVASLWLERRSYNKVTAGILGGLAGLLVAVMIAMATRES